MKKFNLLLVLLFSLVVFSCQDKDEVNPDNPGEKKDLPKFDESNTKAVDWTSLPDALKNAKEDTTTLSNAKVSAYYKYSIGPWGGGGGGAYSFYPAGANDKIYAIGIRAGSYVDALVVWYITPAGTLYYRRAGGTGGAYYVNYFSAGEYIYAIGGRSGSYVDRLTIYTNYKWFSYGGNGGGAFYRSVPYGDQILGFFGGAGSYIDRIGGWVYSF